MKSTLTVGKIPVVETPMKTLSLEVVDIQETRDLHQTKDALGNVVDIQPVEGTHRAFLKLKTPNGAIFQAEISPATLTTHIVPALKP
jgi:hypothetical protein